MIVHGIPVMSQGHKDGAWNPCDVTRTQGWCMESLRCHKDTVMVHGIPVTSQRQGDGVWKPIY